MNNNTINNAFINGIFNNDHSRDIIAVFKNGREIGYTYDIFELLKTDKTVTTIYDANTGEIIYTRDEQPEPAATAADPEPEQPAEPEETAQEKTDRENREHCERIAKELEAYAAGRVWRCPDCGEIIEIDDDDGAPVCPDCGEELEQCSLWDYFDDVYDIEYSISGNMEYRSVRLMIACGGPNIYIDTGTKSIELYWWTDRASYGLLSDTCEEIDSIFEEYFTCNR